MLFNANSIRVVTIEGQPWFLGSDILRVLYGATDGKGHLYGRLGEDEVRKVNRISLGFTGGKPMAVLSESGLYKLIMRSDKPQARAFQDWVTREVLPSIRKTGAYVTGQPSIVENPNMDPLSLLMTQVPCRRRRHKEATAAPQVTGERPQ